MVIDQIYLHFRCLRVFTEEPKKIPVSTIPVTTATQQKPKTTATATKIMTLIEKQRKDAEQAQKKFQLSEGLK